MDLEWSETSIEDMAALDKVIARRIKQAVERFARTGAGNVKRLQDIDPPDHGDIDPAYDDRHHALPAVAPNV